MHKYIYLFLFLFSQSSFAFDDFKVGNIRVSGLERFSESEVINNFSLKVGDVVNNRTLSLAIKSLYETDMFSDVSAEKNATTILLKVTERPIIDSLNIVDSGDLDAETLEKSYRRVGLYAGRPLDMKLLKQASNELKNQYVSTGVYGTKVTNEIKKLPRNRVAIVVKVVEGVKSLIKNVKFVGNTKFTSKTLAAYLKLKPVKWYDLLGGSDKFSQEGLSNDIRLLNEFYLDRGYLKIKILSTDISLTKDRSGIIITYNISEGNLFRVGKVIFTGLDDANLKSSIKSKIKIKPGSIYSKKELIKMKSLIEQELGDDSYALSTVDVEVENLQKDKADVKFKIVVGQKTYIRKIIIKGNTRTRDSVIRQELRNYEGGKYLAVDVTMSLSRIRRTGYFESVKSKIKPVLGSSNQIDLIISVVEKSSGNFKLGAGFSESGGVSFNAGLKHNNFLGTGKTFDFDLNISESSKQFRLDLADPYFTVSGISLGYGIFYNDKNTSTLDVASYSKNDLGFNVNLGIPVNEYDKIYLGTKASYAEFSCGEKFSECTDYVNSNYDSKNNKGYNFKLIDLYLSWTQDTRNRAIFPLSGSFRSALISFGVGDAKYKKINLVNKLYLPIKDDSTLKISANVAYGESNEGGVLPFFETFFSGGVSSVRGFLGASLSPKTKNNPSRSLGGSFKTVLNFDLITPVPFVDDMPSVRLDAFVDSGYVFDNIQSFDLNSIRASAGLGMLWLSPVGPIQFSVAKPIIYKDGDSTETFQFNIGNIF